MLLAELRSMRGTIVFLSVLLCALKLSAAFGSERHEFSGATSGIFAFTSDQTLIRAQVDYKNMILPDSGLQIGPALALDYFSASGRSTTAWVFLAGGRYNFPGLEELENRFFAEADAGGSYTSSGAFSLMKFTYGGAFGKRFKLLAGLSYKPSLSITKTAGENVLFAINAVAVSFSF